MRASTTVWGVAADQAGIIHYQKLWQEEIPGGGVRVMKRDRSEHEPATAYAASHPAPMPMGWGHGEEIGRIVALRRDGGRLLAVGETTLEPHELAWLTKEYGDLRWSPSTENRRRDPLRITEISLTPNPATVGLPAVRWWQLDVVKGNLPGWVKEELQRADKTEFRFRHRGELQIHDLDYERNPYSDVERYQRDVGLIPSDRAATKTMMIEGERVPVEYRPSRIISVRR